MRKFKFILPLIAVLLLVGAGLYAMHANKSQAKAYDVEYWDYNGQPGGEDTASNYSSGTRNPTHSNCGVGDEIVCQIQAEPDPANPNQPNLNGLNPKVSQAAFDTKFRNE